MLWPGRDIRLRDLLRALWSEYRRDEIMDVAGALTFYTFLAVFPFLLFLISLGSRLLTSRTTHGLLGGLEHVAPDPVSKLVADRLRVLQHGGGVGALTLSLLGAIWSCMAAVVSLMTALNRAYDVRETRSFWAVRGMALLATIILGVLAIFAAGITVAVPFVGGAIGGRFGNIVSWLRFPVAGALMVLVLATTYRFLPNVKPRLQAIMPGSMIGVALWLLTSWGFSVYVRNIGTYEIVYGVLGAVIVLLLWMWISGQVVLLGAEINKLLTPREDLNRITTPIEEDRIELPRKSSRSPSPPGS